MKRRLRFRVNGELHEREAREESLALDFLRGELGLKGTKEGCREGDCGACMVLLGRPALDGGPCPEWVASPSCLLAMGELDGRHLITIEGLSSQGVGPIHEALLSEGASQCGFCSPGFVVSLAAFLLDPVETDPERAMIAIEGNLCRCTGYASILRAAKALARDFAGLPLDRAARVAALAVRGVLSPALAGTMASLPEPVREPSVAGGAAVVLGGGTDHFVRFPDPDEGASVVFADLDPSLRRITRAGGRLELGAAVAVGDFFASPEVRGIAPGIEGHEALMASLPIRNRATLAGNLANASPVADMASMLLALGASLRLASPSGERELPLSAFFLSYKKTALAPGERIGAIILPDPGEPVLFGFEKASKRERLDIASVNASMAARLSSGRLAGFALSAGGVAPVPLLLAGPMALAEGRAPTAALARAVAAAAERSVSPISDVRGSADYRRALTGRLVLSLFARLFPSMDREELFA